MSSAIGGGGGGGVTATSPTDNYLAKFSGGNLVNSAFKSDANYADAMNRFRNYYLGSTQTVDIYGDGGSGRVIWALAGYSGAKFQHPTAVELAAGSTTKLAVTSSGVEAFLKTATPASASATGTTGTIAWDADYIYICTATDTWKRVAIATW